MTFQFRCPNGCLLEGEPAQAGQTINCPLCSVLFRIPEPVGAVAQQAPAAQPATEHPAAEHPAQVVEQPAPTPTAEPRLYHIPCPNGHELETPEEMLGQEVMCPHCNAQFQLRESDSVEYRRKKEMERERRDRRIGNAWFNWAIVCAVLVVFGLLFLIISASAG